MDSNKAIFLLEQGTASCLYTTILIMKCGLDFFVSFDGHDWEKVDSKLIQDLFSS